MREGLNLTENQLQQVFRRHGLERVDPLGEKFDPNVHEALFQVSNVLIETRDSLSCACMYVCMNLLCSLVFRVVLYLSDCALF